MPTADEMLDSAAVRGLADALERAGADAETLRASADDLEDRGFKERVVLARDAVLADLPDDYPAFEAVLRSALEDGAFRGWMTLPASEAVAVRGLAAFEPALELLAALTPRLSSEFAVRPFLNSDLPRALAVVRRWTADPDPHVRRLASEGTRPRLPWAARIPALMADPGPALPVLDALYRDDSEYVRRSVANHLNDIGRDSPGIAVATARWWLASPGADTPRVVRHGLRGLVKQGHPGALEALGYPADVPVVVDGPRLGSARVAVGGSLDFTATVTNLGATTAAVAIDYVVHHVKANGTRTAKVFKLTTRTLAPGEQCSLRRAHSFRPISTRRYHPGIHGIQLQVNGRRHPMTEFELTV
ncbi:DNA alkylation repair protein [Actinorugispora endophytica]|uniref:3-methyladenine DNA glycosylase AlkC n=1 Tax=Actinorugispora endophytica TaxID=1605990 RepID=A0A4R6UWB6_9ACTN|nr:DNA alkylation repair protein [Actinorugispora endophytica]TDQ51582.1 3-methyladenine DNA glycosylase AlkC [Actinorugispora endophytica]